jgi:hypothetical protein
MKVGGGDRVIERQRVLTSPKLKIDLRGFDIDREVEMTSGGHNGDLLGEGEDKNLKAGCGDRPIE